MGLGENIVVLSHVSTTSRPEIHRAMYIPGLGRTPPRVLPTTRVEDKSLRLSAWITAMTRRTKI